MRKILYFPPSLREGRSSLKSENRSPRGKNSAHELRTALFDIQKDVGDEVNESSFPSWPSAPFGKDRIRTERLFSTRLGGQKLEPPGQQAFTNWPNSGQTLARPCQRRPKSG